MALQVYVFLFVFFLLLSLALLWRLCWLPLQPSHFRARAVRIPLHRLRHRPALQTIAPPVDSPPLPRRVEGQRHCLCVPGVR